MEDKTPKAMMNGKKWVPPYSALSELEHLLPTSALRRNSMTGIGRASTATTPGQQDVPHLQTCHPQGGRERECNFPGDAGLLVSYA